MKKLNAAVFGAGFVGRVHIEALRRLANVGVVDRVGDYRQLLADPTIDAVHVCTPNSLHFPMAKAALEAGKHVLCEKPLAISVAEARELVALAGQTGLRNCTCHNLRFYPMVQHIGSHWCDGIEHVTGRRITSLCADLQTFHKTRKRPSGAIQTFAGKTSPPHDYEDAPIDTEDYAAVMFRMGDRTRGCFTVSQMSAGRKNSYRFEIFGTKAGLAWDGERPDELWIGHRNAPNQVLLKDPSLLKDAARPYADLPGGHAEGYDDTFKQVFRRFYQSIEDPGAEAQYPQFADGLRQLTIVDAELASHRQRGWMDVPA